MSLAVEVVLRVVVAEAEEAGPHEFRVGVWVVGLAAKFAELLDSLLLADRAIEFGDSLALRRQFRPTIDVSGRIPIVIRTPHRALRHGVVVVGR